MQILASNKAPIEEAIEAGTNTGLAFGGVMLTRAGRLVPFGLQGQIAVGAALSLFSGASAYFQTSSNQALAKIQCGKLTTSGDPKYGCSVVQPIDYHNVTAIKQFCNGGIEGSLYSDET